MNRRSRNAWMLARAIARVPNGPLFSPEDPPGGGGGGGGDPPKMISEAEAQARIDKVVGQRLADERKKYADFDSLKEKAAKAAEYETELAKLREEKETAGKSAEEVRKIEADRAAKQLERERNEATTKLTASEQAREAAEKKFQNMVIANALGSGLDASKVLPRAREDAIVLLRAQSTVELDDDGNVASVTYGGVAYKTPAEAAAAFLKDKDHLASAGLPRGGGTQLPNSGGGREQPANGSAESLLAQGFAARTKR